MLATFIERLKMTARIERYERTNHFETSKITLSCKTKIKNYNEEFDPGSG